jgi:hypothetical protein
LPLFSRVEPAFDNRDGAIDKGGCAMIVKVPAVIVGAIGTIAEAGNWIERHLTGMARKSISDKACRKAPLRSQGQQSSGRTGAEPQLAPTIGL